MTLLIAHKHRSLVSAALVAISLTAAACGDTNADVHATSTAPMTAGAPTAATMLNAPPALLEAREAVWRAYFTGDSALLVSLLPEEMVGMGETRAQIIANSLAFARGSRRYEGITFSDDEFILSDSLAVTFANYEVKLSENGKPMPRRGRAIEVFRLRDGRWTNPSWHLHDK